MTEFLTKLFWRYPHSSIVFLYCEKWIKKNPNETAQNVPSLIPKELQNS